MRLTCRSISHRCGAAEAPGSSQRKTLCVRRPSLKLCECASSSSQPDWVTASRSTNQQLHSGGSMNHLMEARPALASLWRRSCSPHFLNFFEDKYGHARWCWLRRMGSRGGELDASLNRRLSVSVFLLCET